MLYKTEKSTALDHNILLTGSTGVIGSHVLYELIKLKADDVLKGKILVLIRPKTNKSPEERLSEILAPGVIPDFLKPIDLFKVRKDIIIVGGDLADIQGIRSQVLKHVNRFTILHLAASVNLASTDRAYDEVLTNNYDGTINLLKGLMRHCAKFVFISTAFASGHRKGRISDHFLDISEKQFRNPYEFFKAKTEKRIAEICDANNLEWQILRPSIVCGRLIDTPHFVITDYLVFYLFGAFFYKLSQKELSKNKLRIQVNKQSGMNIIPVDYAAKAIVMAIDSPIRELNIVSSNNILNTQIVETIFKMIGIENWDYVDDVPEEMNDFERIYYGTVGKQFNPYWNTSSYEFDTSRLRDLVGEIEEPNVGQCFGSLFDYALRHEFRRPLAS